MLAHNGEINTVKGNVNWMKSHEIRMASDAFAGHEDDIKPIVQPGSSDSAALDAVFETLARAGRSAPLDKVMLVPEAWAKNSSIHEAHRAMYAYANSVMEPWDGPAAIARDRRALGDRRARPQRPAPAAHTITEDGLLCVGSESGHGRRRRGEGDAQGPRRPGQMIAVDLAEGRKFHGTARKDKLAAEHPYEQWVQNVVELEPIVGPGPEPRLFEAADLRRRQVAAGATLEELELILRRWWMTPGEAVG